MWSRFPHRENYVPPNGILLQKEVKIIEVNGQLVVGVRDRRDFRRVKDSL